MHASGFAQMYAVKTSYAALAHGRHSLGGALAQLAAYDIAIAHDGLPISCYTFGGPRCDVCNSSCAGPVCVRISVIQQPSDD